MKKIFSALLMLTMLLLVACGGKTEEKAAAPAAKAEASGLKVGIVLSTGGLGDKSFNDSAHRGLEKAKAELGVDFKYVEPASPSEDEQFLREYADAGYDLDKLRKGVFKSGKVAYKKENLMRGGD